MVRRLALGLVVLSLAGTAGCAPQMAVNGFQAVDERPQDIKAGQDTRSSVLSKLGTPSTTGAFDPNTWYYITQTTEKYAYYLPHVQNRTVVEIAFDKDDKVTAVKTLSLKDGYQIAYASGATPTRGKELNWLEQILGTIGRSASMLNPNDLDPGKRPGQQ